MKYNWKETGQKVDYYYTTDNGLIVGQIHNIAHTQIWVAMILNLTEERHLGRFVSHEFAKNAVQKYWDIQERTLLDYGNV